MTVSGKLTARAELTEFVMTSVKREDRAELSRLIAAFVAESVRADRAKRGATEQPTSPTDDIGGTFERWSRSIFGDFDMNQFKK